MEMSLHKALYSSAQCIIGGSLLLLYKHSSIWTIEEHWLTLELFELYIEVSYHHRSSTQSNKKETSSLVDPNKILQIHSKSISRLIWSMKLMETPRQVRRLTIQPLSTQTTTSMKQMAHLCLCRNDLCWIRDCLVLSTNHANNLLIFCELQARDALKALLKMRLDT